MHTYAVMGVNTAFLQAIMVTKAKVHTTVPEKMEARLDMNDGYFNLQLLPVERVNPIASALWVHVFIIQIKQTSMFVWI